MPDDERWKSGYDDWKTTPPDLDLGRVHDGCSDCGVLLRPDEVEFCADCERERIDADDLRDDLVDPDDDRPPLDPGEVDRLGAPEANARRWARGERGG